MGLYKETAKLSPQTAAYIAGLIDGEGTITLSRRHAKDKRQLVISIANTERAILAFVLEATGVGKITRKRVVSSKHTPSFCYSIGNKQAFDLLRQIAPYLRSYKVDRATLVLTRYKEVTPRNGKYSAEQLIERNLFESKFFSILPLRSE